MADSPKFTGVIDNDLNVLAECFLGEIERVEETCMSDFDAFSVGVNDGLRMRVNLACTDGGSGVRFGEFLLDDLLMVGWEAMEQRYTALASAGADAITPEAVAKLDESLLALYRNAGVGDGEPSLDTGVHIPFQGKQGVPKWSLLIRNETARTLVCSMDGGDAAYELFSGVSARKNPPKITYMPRLDSVLPMGIFVPRAMQQIEAQSLEADVIMFAREGMMLSGGTAADLWKTYCLLRDRIIAEAEERRGRLTWIFHGAEPLLSAELLDGAQKALKECLEDDRRMVVWDSARQGFVRRAISLPEVVQSLERGYPDYRTAAAGGIAPMIVDIQAGDSVRQISRRVKDAWKKYRQRYTEECPLLPEGVEHKPSVVVLARLGVITFGRDEKEAELAYNALSQALLLMESAQGFNGIRPFTDREALGVARGRFMAMK